MPKKMDRDALYELKCENRELLRQNKELSCENEKLQEELSWLRLINTAVDSDITSLENALKDLEEKNKANKKR